MVSAKELLEGPRGRGLCLHLATSLDEEVMSAVFDLGYQFDPDAGTSRVRMTFAGDDPDGAPRPAPHTIGDLTRLLAAPDLNGITPDLLDEALARSVDDARYWQSPPGEDILAGRPDIIAALAPLADAVAEAAPEWWSADRRVEQWAIEWREPGDPVSLSTDPAVALAQWRANTLAEEASAERDRPRDPTANWSGTWWTTPHGVITTTGDTDTNTAQPVGLRHVEDGFGWEQATAIPIRGAGRTYEIHDAEAWAQLCRRHPLDVSASRRHDWFRTTGRDGRWFMPDWQSVATEWDAVHLSARGYLRAATRAISVDDDHATVIAGFSPDLTIWLTDRAREWEGGRVEWRCDEPHSSDNVWRRA
ncbi:hypothetical protein PU630_03700 [Microbacterium horticulturae]|uniref:Uncharacterized protein n=1 Tax=Microbacterium horticulturae TaxID=3028316 RepID=A0ABY8C2U3_9MICO|nr:hypothetical protein [Microbacterium sp. KACC 23027]WEG09682.1 hypothetical protein PU630_03700 [Microbacterium sp. KACC 23027]